MGKQLNMLVEYDEEFAGTFNEGRKVIGFTIRKMLGVTIAKYWSDVPDPGPTFTECLRRLASDGWQVDIFDDFEESGASCCCFYNEGLNDDLGKVEFFTTGPSPLALAAALYYLAFDPIGQSTLKFIATAVTY